MINLEWEDFLLIILIIKNIFYYQMDKFHGVYKLIILNFLENYYKMKLKKNIKF